MAPATPRRKTDHPDVLARGEQYAHLCFVQLTAVVSPGGSGQDGPGSQRSVKVSHETTTDPRLPVSLRLVTPQTPWNALTACLNSPSLPLSLTPPSGPAARTHPPTCVTSSACRARVTWTALHGRARRQQTPCRLLLLLLLGSSLTVGTHMPTTPHDRTLHAQLSAQYTTHDHRVTSTAPRTPVRINCSQDFARDNARPITQCTATYPGSANSTSPPRPRFKLRLTGCSNSSLSILLVLLGLAAAAVNSLSDTTCVAPWSTQAATGESPRQCRSKSQSKRRKRSRPLSPARWVAHRRHKRPNCHLKRRHLKPSALTATLARAADDASNGRWHRSAYARALAPNGWRRVKASPGGIWTVALTALMSPRPAPNMRRSSGPHTAINDNHTQRAGGHDTAWEHPRMQHTRTTNPQHMYFQRQEKQLCFVHGLNNSQGLDIALRTVDVEKVAVAPIAY